MSAFENVITGKLKLKGKALRVQAGGVNKKRKNRKFCEYDYSSQCTKIDQLGDDTGLIENIDDTKYETSEKYGYQLTSAEMKYMEQFEKINMRRVAKEATKSHRHRIQEFNRHLANLSDHYDIPKVGPG